MAAQLSHKRRIVRRIVRCVAIPVGVLVWYLVSVLCLRGGGAAGWIPRGPYTNQVLKGFNVPLVWYVRSEMPGHKPLRWLVLQAEIAGSRYHPSQR
jgi:hypothetical protein